MQFNLICDWCGKPFVRNKKNRHNFCCRQCLADYSSKSKNPDGYIGLKDFTNIAATFKRVNAETNKKRMTLEVRQKLREAKLDVGGCHSYRKYYGKHEHRIVAERLLRRPLLPGEVVHHRDGDKRNNDPENLVVFASQGDHVRHHNELRWFIQQIKAIEGGEDE